MPRTLRTSNPVRRGHPLNQGRIAWWITLPHTQGTTTWFDIVGTNHASLVGMGNATNGWRPTHRPGGFGHLVTDGSAGYLLNTNLPSSGNMAFAAWVVRGAGRTASGYGSIAGHETLPAASDWYFYFNPSNVLSIDIPYVLANAAVGGTVSDTTSWHQVGFTRSGTTGSWSYSIFLDGKVTATATTTSNPVLSPFYLSLASSFSGAVGAATNFQQLAIDDASVWFGNPIATANPAAFAALHYDQSIRGNPDTLNYF